MPQQKELLKRGRSWQKKTEGQEEARINDLIEQQEANLEAINWCRQARKKGAVKAVRIQS